MIMVMSMMILLMNLMMMMMTTTILDTRKVDREGEERSAAELCSKRDAILQPCRSMLWPGNRGSFTPQWRPRGGSSRRCGRIKRAEFRLRPMLKMKSLFFGALRFASHLAVLRVLCWCGQQVFWRGRIRCCTGSFSVGASWLPPSSFRASSRAPVSWRDAVASGKSILGVLTPRRLRSSMRRAGLVHIAVPRPGTYPL